MFRSIAKRMGLHLIIYSVIFYLIPYISIYLLQGNIGEIINALFLVILNLIIIIILSSIDSYRYKLNFFFWLIPSILFIPSIYLFYEMDLLLYSLIYATGYGIGMLLGWSYRTYGYQLKSGYKKIYKEEKEKMKNQGKVVIKKAKKLKTEKNK